MPKITIGGARCVWPGKLTGLRSRILKLRSTLILRMRPAIRVLGIAYLELEAHEAATAQFDKALKLEADDEAGRSYYWRGRTHFAAEDYEAAIADLGQAIERLPATEGDALYWRGRAHFAQENYQAAGTDFDQVLVSISKAHAESLYWRGRTYFETEQYPAALTDLSQAVAEMS